MKRWYLVYCKRYEQQRAFQHLTNQNVECFYPKIKVMKTSKSKIQQADEPLYPSYMFVSFNVQQSLLFSAIRSTRGVVDFVRFGTNPKEVPAELVATLKCYDSLNDLHRKKLEPIDRDVEMHSHGGIDAVFKEKCGERREHLFLQMLSQYKSPSVTSMPIPT
ncbi:transcription/translation regulatory transformer protein RfaH [Vibrio sp. PNB23_22_6]|uniref:transcription/translation regulatory transformer protein RfaH n=1 Tax=Vibrio TaxID=662 RepID=UPI004068D484